MQHLPLSILECCFPAWEKPLSEKSSHWVGGDLLTLNEVATQILVLVFTCYYHPKLSQIIMTEQRFCKLYTKPECYFQQFKIQITLLSSAQVLPHPSSVLSLTSWRRTKDPFIQLEASLATRPTVIFMLG